MKIGRDEAERFASIDRSGADPAHTYTHVISHRCTRTRTHKCRNSLKRGSFALPANTPSHTTSQYRTSAGTASFPHRWKTIPPPPLLYSVWMSRENRGSKGWGSEPSCLLYHPHRTIPHNTTLPADLSPLLRSPPRHCIPPLNWQHQGRHHTA